MFFSRYLDSHWLLIDSNRNYPADVVGSRYNRVLFSPRHRRSSPRLFFYLFLYRSSRLSFLVRNTFLAVATRSSRPEGYPPTCALHTLSHQTRALYLSRARYVYPPRPLLARGRSENYVDVILYLTLDRTYDRKSKFVS